MDGYGVTVFKEGGKEETLGVVDVENVDPKSTQGFFDGW